MPEVDNTKVSNYIIQLMERGELFRSLKLDAYPPTANTLYKKYFLKVFCNFTINQIHKCSPFSLQLPQHLITQHCRFYLIQFICKHRKGKLRCLPAV